LEPPLKFDPPFVLLEDRLDRSSPVRLYTQPVQVIRCDQAEKVQGALSEIEAALSDGLHAAGFLAYELGHALEPRLQLLLMGRRADPLLQVGLFAPPTLLTADEADAVFAGLPAPPPLVDLRPDHSREVHVTRVRRILDLISAGDIYQANLTFPMRFRYEGDPLSLYAALRCCQPTAYNAVVALGRDWALSVSPELFVRIEGELIESRPMKGTAPRGPDATTDAEALDALLADPKQRAENLMITDLIRNDLARISAPGSVRVPRLFTPETYPTFYALTSTVTARLKPGVGLRERIAAIFPCGSIVGAPKVRAAEVLADLEDAARGVYTGAIGAFAPDGDATLSVAIRTAVLRSDGTGTYGVGGGVVADSDPDAEYDEALLKSYLLQNLAQDFQLIETLRWSASIGFVRLGGHIGRLTESAVKLGFVFDRAAAAAELERQALAWGRAGVGDQRVRLLLHRNGVLHVAGSAAPQDDGGLALVGVSRLRLDAADPFLRHKTSRRAVYDAATAQAEASGWSEAVILNRSGAVADGARHTLFAKIDGLWLTPPLGAGALPGVLRAELLDVGHVAEHALYLPDLKAADRLLIGNSLRGLRAARFDTTCSLEGR
jgi:para-aminobenzoate synthetase / 4-amino-4-deoxychorismate lyase